MLGVSEKEKLFYQGKTSSQWCKGELNPLEGGLSRCGNPEGSFGTGRGLFAGVYEPGCPSPLLGWKTLPLDQPLPQDPLPKGIPAEPLSLSHQDPWPQPGQMGMQEV